MRHALNRLERIGRARRIGVGAGLAIGLGAALWAPAALADADLVIVQSDSRIVAGGCRLNEPLATGLIVVKNEGASRANRKFGVIDRFARSLVAVYVPEHLDMIDRVYERAILEPKDQESVSIAVGRGVVKAGRFLDGEPVDPNWRPGTSFQATSQSIGGAEGAGATGGLITTTELDTTARLDPTELSVEERRDIQRALTQLGHYAGPIDGVFGAGIERAIGAYQVSEGAPQTGRLTIGQVLDLDGKTGIFLAIGQAGYKTVTRPVEAVDPPSAPTTPRQAQPGAGPVKHRITLYAVVDPFNVVAESDETNNLVKFPIEIVCPR